MDKDYGTAVMEGTRTGKEHGDGHARGGWCAAVWLCRMVKGLHKWILACLAKVLFEFFIETVLPLSVEAHIVCLSYMPVLTCS